MNKLLLIRHIKGDVSAAEREAVISWIDKSKDNEAYYLTLMNLVIMKSAVIDSTDDMMGVGEKRDAYKEIMKRIDSGADGDKGVVKLSGRKGMLFGRWISYAAAVLLLASVGLNLYQFGSTKEVEVVVTKVPAVKNIINTYYTENGVKGRVLLPDSSIVWLNSGSKVTYPEQFNSDKRSVEFEGEGYFDVVSNPKWPMEVVTAKGMKISVLGTKFHIKSYNNDDEEQATLFTGKIDISKSNGDKKVLEVKELKPRESLRFTASNTPVLTKTADTTKKVAWMRGELLFEQTPMQEVIKMLERWHGVEIIVKDPAVLSYKFTASFTSESIIQIMELLRFTSPLDYKIDEKRVFIEKRKI